MDPASADPAGTLPDWFEKLSFRVHNRASPFAVLPTLLTDAR